MSEPSLGRMGAAPSDFSYPPIGSEVVTSSNLLAHFWPWAVFAWLRCVGRFCLCSEGPEHIEWSHPRIVSSEFSVSCFYALSVLFTILYFSVSMMPDSTEMMGKRTCWDSCSQGQAAPSGSSCPECVHGGQGWGRCACFSSPHPSRDPV